MGDSSYNWIATILNIVAGFLLKTISDEASNNYSKFRDECRIRAELEDVTHNLEVAGRPNERIETAFGAEFIRHNPQRLFGEHNREVLGFYTDIFDDYNLRMPHGTYTEHEALQHSMINRMVGILNTPWLMKIPSEPSWWGFIKYKLNHDAQSTYEPISEYLPH